MTESPGLLARRWRRIVGRVIDVVMWSPIVVVFGWLAVDSPLAREASDAGRILLAVSATFFATLLVVVYEVASTLLVGATLGKKIVGTRIVTEDRDDPGLRRMVLRMAPLIAMTLLSSVPVIGLLTGPAAIVVVVASVILLSTDERRQTVWDKTGRTLVVRD